MKTNLIFALVFLNISIALAQMGQEATGIVFHDLNADGERNRNEPGIYRVAVSNGVDVVLTDTDGRYIIPISDDDIIFVIKPSGFKYPVNEKNLPQFYYIHKPAGSPTTLDYAGVAPTGPLPESVDFGLLTGNHSDQFSIIVFSDPQPYTEQEIGFYDKAIVEELVGIKGFDFGITLGDLVGDRLDFFAPLNKATARIGLPWFHVYGNHDMNFDVDTHVHADETFESVYGPTDFAFNHGKVHFIVLNNVIYPNTYDARLYVGGLRDDQFQFIENTLRHVPKDHLVVICTHIPLFDEHPLIDSFRDDHLKRLFALLKDRPYTFSMSGHTHTQRHHYFTKEDGWLQERPHHHFNVATASGDWWSGEKDEKGIPDAMMRDGSPKGYTFIHFDGNQYSFDFIAAGQPEHFKMRIYGPRAVPQNVRRFRGEFFVNFFQGSENCIVEFKVNDGDWRPMMYVVLQDPYVAEIGQYWDNRLTFQYGIRRPSNPFPSFHLWRVRAPTQLPLGKNIFHVRITDKQGRIHYDQKEFEVVQVEAK